MAMALQSMSFNTADDLCTWASANISAATKIVEILFDAASGKYVVFYTT